MCFYIRRCLSRAAQLSAAQEGPSGAGRGHRVLNRQVSPGIHDVRLLLWTRGSGLAPRQDRLVRQRQALHTWFDLTHIPCCPFYFCKTIKKPQVSWDLYLSVNSHYVVVKARPPHVEGSHFLFFNLIFPSTVQLQSWSKQHWHFEKRFPASQLKLGSAIYFVIFVEILFISRKPSISQMIGQIGICGCRMPVIGHALPFI